MMNSSYSSDTALSFKINRRSLFVLVASLALGGCGSDEEVKSCDDDDIPAIPSMPNTALVRSQLKLETRTSFDIDGVETKGDNLAQIDFVDGSRIERISRSINDQKFSMTCSGLTGAVTDKCREPYEEPDCHLVWLDVVKVEVSGVPGLQLQKQSTGKYNHVKAPDPLFGDDEISVAVTGKNEEAFYPSFDLSLTPPEPLVVEKPTSTDLIGSRDLEICWKRGDGDLIEILLSVKRADGSTNDTDKVVCLVKDDGCHIVPISALDWLRLGDMKPKDQFRLSLARQKIAVKEIDDKTAAEIKAAHRVELLLAQDDG